MVVPIKLAIATLLIDELSPFMSCTPSGTRWWSVEEIRLAPDNVLVHRLVVQPGHERCGQMVPGVPRGFLGYDLHRRARRLGLELDTAGAVGGDEPPGGLVHTLPPGAEQAVILVDSDLRTAERLRHPASPPTLDDDGASLLGDQRLVL